MIINENISPYADERRCKARMLLYTEEGAEPVVFENADIKSFSCIKEHQILQTSRPDGELTISIFDSEGDFDITNEDSMYYSLNSKSTLELSISCVENGCTDEYISICKCLFREASSVDGVATLFASDFLYLKDLDNLDAKVALGTTAKNADEAVELIFGYLGFSNKGIVSENLQEFKYVDRYYLTSLGQKMRGALDGIATFMQKESGHTVRYALMANGDIKYFSLSTEADVIIKKSEYIDCKVEALEDTGGKPALFVEDRGNILLELGDTAIVQADEDYNIEIYMIKLDYDRGILKGQMKGRIQ